MSPLKIAGLALLAALLLEIGELIWSLLAPSFTILLGFEDGVSYYATVRHRYFFWLSDNCTWRRTIFARHWLAIQLDRAKYRPTLQHEGQHVRDDVEKGERWMLTHAAEREARAIAVQGKPFPTVTFVARD